MTPDQLTGEALEDAGREAGHPKLGDKAWSDLGADEKREALAASDEAATGDEPQRDDDDDDGTPAAPFQSWPLEHTQGGTTTKDDATDLGVDMLPGDPSEPAGPEDALGVGDKRGDYPDRIGPANYDPHTSVATDDGGEPIVVDGEVVDYKPVSRLEPQRPRAEERGDVPGEKGGVTT